MISYIEDKNLLAKSFNDRNYDYINAVINDLIEENKLNYYENGLGYKVKKINQLSEIYNQKFFAVNFYFNNLKPFFDEEMKIHFDKMIKNLKKFLEENEGYFIIKIPSHIPNLINSLKIVLQKNNIFTGGTICYSINQEVSELKKDDDLTLKMLDFGEYDKYKDYIKNLSYESFKNYFGQYHISDYTRPKAPIIYKNWVRDFFKNPNENNRMIVAEINEKVVGFLTLYKNSHAYELVLSGVDKDYRGNRVYERMIRFGVNYSQKNHKICTLSTQFDNIFVQRAWINIGFKPYYSYYLFHFNNLR